MPFRSQVELAGAGTWLFLRSTHATRLIAGGVADEYKLNRKASESGHQGF